MKTLYLLRHAQAESDRANDVGRNLSAKGRMQAESIGKWMSENGIMPEWIISSSAKRTRLTAKVCSERIGYQRSIRFEDALYDAGVDRYLDIIAALNTNYDSVMIVGHNPAISAVASMLTGVHLDMSPCMLVCVGLGIDEWESVKDADSRLKWFHIP